MSEFTVEAIEGKEHGGEQYGWRVLKDGEALFDCTTGGTGPCWNISDSGDIDPYPIHLCDLDDAINALAALRDAEAHKQNVARWQ